MIQKNPAVDLQARYRKTFEAALIAALAIAIVAFKFFPDVAPPKPLEQGISTPPIIVEPPLTSHPEIPPPTLPPLKIENSADVPPVDLPIGTDLVPDAVVPPPPPPEDEPYFERVESLPKPIGGLAALQARVIYPDMARRVGIEGTVVVLAYVDETGIVTKAQIVKSVGFGCDEAALKAVKETRFYPGTQRDKPVKVKMSIPLRFKLRQ